MTIFVAKHYFLHYSTSKLMVYAYNRHLSCDKRSLEEAYNKPSLYKRQIWNKIKQTYDGLNGTDIKVHHTNSYQFSVTFFFQHDDRKYFVYITRTQSLFIEYNELLEIRERVMNNTPF